MAIYHLSVKTVSRSAGRSSTAAAAYRSGEKIHDERTGETFDYGRKSGIEETGIVTPEGSPDWTSNREQLWNKAEQSETRKNSTVAREFVVALPSELSVEQRSKLVKEFAEKLVERHGVVVDYAIHKPNKAGSDKNFHAHLLLTTRKLENGEFTKKTRELDKRGSGEIQHWRKEWAEISNQHLGNAGIENTIDHRSLKDQGIDREPTVHLGHNVVALERDGFKTRRGDINRAINETKNNVIDFDAAIKKLKAKKVELQKQEAKKKRPDVTRRIKSRVDAKKPKVTITREQVEAEWNKAVLKEFKVIEADTQKAHGEAKIELAEHKVLAKDQWNAAPKRPKFLTGFREKSFDKKHNAWFEEKAELDRKGLDLEKKVSDLDSYTKRGWDRKPSKGEVLAVNKAVKSNPELARAMKTIQDSDQKEAEAAQKKKREKIKDERIAKGEAQRLTKGMKSEDKKAYVDRTVKALEQQKKESSSPKEKEHLAMMQKALNNTTKDRGRGR